MLSDHKYEDVKHRLLLSQCTDGQLVQDLLLSSDGGLTSTFPNYLWMSTTIQGAMESASFADIQRTVQKAAATVIIFSAKRT